jgi:hypothetical protein
MPGGIIGAAMGARLPGVGALRSQGAPGSLTVSISGASTHEPGPFTGGRLPFALMRTARGSIVVAALAILATAAPAAAAPAPDFTLKVKPVAQVLVGGSSTMHVTTQDVGGFHDPVTITVDKLPPGASASVDAKGHVTISAKQSTVPDIYVVTVTATQITQDPKPISHSVPVTLIASLPVNHALSKIVSQSFHPFVHGKWKGPVPAACAAHQGSGPCVFDYTNEGLPNRLKQIVVLDPLPVPRLTLETFHFEDLKCNLDGTITFGDAIGTADGPFPGTVALVTPSFSSGPSGDAFGAFYNLTSDGFANAAVETGLLTGQMTGPCRSAKSVDRGFGYDAEYTYFGSTPTTGDEGLVNAVISTPRDGGTSTLDMTFVASMGLPGGASLAPPSPVCPPGGCT